MRLPPCEWCLILKLGQLIGYLIRNIFIEKVYKKYALKPSAIPLFNFSKQCKTTKWTPKDTHGNVSIFIDLVQNDLDKEKATKMKNLNSNLSKGEQKAMEELAKRKNIIIINVDKGGDVVVMDVERYINEANHQLSNKCNYKKTRRPNATTQYFG